ncbi:MBL fold metallo-hydrolase [Salinibaculum rarum]|uniref:MBL fold metallo-hydrolase n=1 Tax=Salinibaculum rarum TaxID=3058903 RepID=UPI00265FE30C|nr:MBL fold metallo-hydrolase [Salinibaculum sp. KK48]
MNVSFENANPKYGDESYLIKFHDDIEDTTACLLVDAGKNVDPEFLLDDDERLIGVLVTHAHLDHIKSLSEVAEANVPIYTSEGTAAILENILDEGAKNYGTSETPESIATYPELHEDNSWESETVVDHLNPITDWQQIFPNVEIHPLPVGHTPGACGFIIRFSDSGETKHILVTGDFTFSNVAGYRGLTPPPIDIDAVFLNSPTASEDIVTENGVNTELTDAIGALYEAATAGQRVVGAATALSGVHIAYLVNHLIDYFEDTIQIRVTGLTAKIYKDLDYDLQHVTATPVYDDPDDVIEPGTITITGPEEPIGGGAKVLFDAIKDDGNATFIQVLTSGEPVSSAACTIAAYEYEVHPREEAIDDFINTVAPMEVIVQHGNYGTFKDKYPASFLWTVEHAAEDYLLYHTGRWHPPTWVTESVERQIRTENDQQPTFEDTFGDEQIATFDSVRRVDPRDVETDAAEDCPDGEIPVLYNEGVSIQRLKDQTMVVTNPNDKSVATPGSGARSSSKKEKAHATDGSGGVAHEQVNAEPQPDPGIESPSTPPNQKDENEEQNDTAVTTHVDNSEVSEEGTASQEVLGDIEERLAAVEQAVSGDDVTGQVVDVGSDVTLLRVDADAVGDDLEHGDAVELTIR